MILYEYLALPPVFDTLNYLLKFTAGTRPISFRGKNKFYYRD